MKSKTVKKAAALQQFFARNLRAKFPQSTGESILSALEIVVKTADITEEDYGGGIVHKRKYWS
jgi:hypothetical protein